MSIRKFILPAMLAASILAPAASFAEDRTIYVRHDPGGDLGLYQVKAQVVRELNLKVVIDGVCASACTMLIGVPSTQVCVTKRAKLRFHRARLKKHVPNGRAILREANRMMLASYPAGVRNWIQQRGGLTDKMLTMESADVMRLFHKCNEPMLVS